MHNHPTSADVYDVVRERHPNISRATVYRNLGVLANRGEVLRVEVPNGADRYDFHNKPHYHAKCRVCGGVFDVDMPYQQRHRVACFRRSRLHHRAPRDHLRRRMRTL
ncbi:MAG: transcriptional repressor [Gordonibacter pamelaeae]